MNRAKQQNQAWLAMVEEGRKRRLKALALFEEGKKPREIGEILGVTRQRAEQMIVRARRDQEQAA